MKVNKITEARDYGGAFDIDPRDYFTKDEVMEFGEEVVATLNDTNKVSLELGEVYLTDNLFEITVTDSEGNEYATTANIDYRKIKSPRDLNKYLNEVVAKLSADINDLSTYESLNKTKQAITLSESLFEDLDAGILKSPTEGPQFGLSELLNHAIKSEFDAISEYNALALAARDEGFEDIAKVAEEIGTEENKHVGQLQEALKLVSPNAEAIEVGKQEGQEQVGEIDNEQPPNTISEGAEDVMDTWQKVLAHFKHIEEVVKDGEAVTALIDEEVRLNKGNEAYEIAYNKWNDGARD